MYFKQYWNISAAVEPKTSLDRLQFTRVPSSLDHLSLISHCFEHGRIDAFLHLELITTGDLSKVC